MPTVLGSLRRLVLAPSLNDVSFAGRGFSPGAPEVTSRLEMIPQAVVVGFEAGIESGELMELTQRLRLIDEELRGFAYEGATMAYTILDQMRPGRRKRARELLLGPAEPYAFLTYIGIGFAMARLPRPRWRAVLPDLTGAPYYPALSWLAVDGYGFDLAYFHPQRYIGRRERPRPYPWLGAPQYFPRAVDQGIGRALWFIQGARVADVAAAISTFESHRQADLWSGVGLAAAFAGGMDAAGYADLRQSADRYWPELAQGVTFAAKARTFSGLVPPHTASAVEVLTDLTVGEAAATVDAAVMATNTSNPQLVYEEWRRCVRERFARIAHAI